MKTKNYIALIEFDEEIGTYGVIVPDIPGFSSGGETYEEAINNAHEGLASHVELLLEYGDEIPEPSTWEEIRKTWDGWDEWNELVPIYFTAFIPVMPTPGEIPFLVSIDSDLVSRIDSVSQDRSAFLSTAAEYMLSNGNVGK